MDDLKKAVALAAAEQIKDGSIVGLGSGTTVAYFLEEIGARIRSKKLNIVGVPTSFQTRFMAKQYGIPLLDPIDVDSIDIAVDGADEVDPKGNLIKGGGGAHVLEKLIASMSKKFVVIVDETKLVTTLGIGFRVPVEVISPALTYVIKRLKEMGGDVIVRSGNGKLGPVVSDLGNPIIDVDFGPIDDPASLEHLMDALPGVLGHGLFVGSPNQLLVAKPPMDAPKIDTVEFVRTANLVS